MAQLRLRVGFPETVPPEQALSEALADWYEVVARAGSTPVGEPSMRVITDDAERAAMGEYLIEVVGERAGGDV